tara:strand:- start:1179 stop:1487 length:309 start_codon:yes stop_codon:yes gene_type:complete
MNKFDQIRNWAEARGIFDKGDVKTQTVKLMEEVGELSRAVISHDSTTFQAELVDAIGDCVVVLTNLSHLAGVKIEDCIDAAYEEIKDRTGHMAEGTFKKDES